MRYVQNIIFLVSVSLCTAVHCAEQNLTLIKVVGENLPPFTYPNGSGQQFDIVREILSNEGVVVDVKVFPYKRAVALVENAEADLMIGMLKDDSYNVLYSALPHDVDRLLAIFTAKNAQHWQGANSLSKKQVTTLAGLAEAFTRYLPVVDMVMPEVGTREQAFSKLIHQRADYLVDSEGSFLAAQNEIPSDVSLVAKPIGYLKIHVAFANSDKGKQLKALWDRKFLSFIQSDKARLIYEHWQLMREYQITQEYLSTVDNAAK